MYTIFDWALCTKSTGSFLGVFNFGCDGRFQCARVGCLECRPCKILASEPSKSGTVEGCHCWRLECWSRSRAPGQSPARDLKYGQLPIRAHLSNDRCFSPSLCHLSALDYQSGGSLTHLSLPATDYFRCSCRLAYV
jgi:hypothetical protein